MVSGLFERKMVTRYSSIVLLSRGLITILFVRVVRSISRQSKGLKAFARQIYDWTRANICFGSIERRAAIDRLVAGNAASA